MTHPVAAAFGTLALAAAIDRYGKRSGATRAEGRATLPGDELVPSPRWQSTRAITIDAPPDAVWPWVVQMGFPSHRAGWYTPHWLDGQMWRIEARSADRIVPELQQLAVGDRVPDSEDGTCISRSPRWILAAHSCCARPGTCSRDTEQWTSPGRSSSAMPARARGS